MRLDGNAADLLPVIFKRADVGLDELAVVEQELGLHFLNQKACSKRRKYRRAK